MQMKEYGLGADILRERELRVPFHSIGLLMQLYERRITPKTHKENRLQSRLSSGMYCVK